MAKGRILVVLILLAIPFALVEARLFNMQVLERETRRGVLDEKTLRIRLLPTSRGRIFARGGEPLAAQDRLFDLEIVPGEAAACPALCASLAGLAALDEKILTQRLTRIRNDIQQAILKETTSKRRKAVRRDLNGRAYPFVENVSFDVAAAVETEAGRFAGLVVRPRSRRVYPHGDLAAHVVGTVGKLRPPARPGQPGEYERLERSGYFSRDLVPLIGEDEYRRQEDVLGAFRDETVGRSGVELSYQERLRGRRGAQITERSVHVRAERGVSSDEAEPGDDLTLTLDAVWQAAAERLLAGRKGAIVVLDVRSGAVLVMASSPGFDPNRLAPPVDAAAARDILGDSANRPLVNRAAADHYPVGSVFKVVTAAAALQEGAVLEDTLLECTGAVEWRGRFYHCWIAEHGAAHGPLPLVDAMRQSCNCFFYQSAERLGMANLAWWARQFGFGARTGIDLPGEQTGIVPDAQGQLLSVAIGQGALTCTPLQVARMMAAVANDGWLVTPHVVRGAPRAGERTRIPVDPQNWVLIRRGLAAVVNEHGGTAHSVPILQELGWIAGKTSTAQVGSGPGAGTPHAWFAGYAPLDEPAVAFAVLIENGGHGGEVAAPVAGELLKSMNLRPPAGVRQAPVEEAPAAPPPADEYEGDPAGPHDEPPQAGRGEKEGSGEEKKPGPSVPDPGPEKTGGEGE